MRKHDGSSNPFPWDILLGRHSYGMIPELETDWCRVFLIMGLVSGFMLGTWAGLH